jgi:hypothetical protein
MNIEPSVVLGIITSIGGILGTVIVTLFRIVMKDRDDLRADRDHYRTLAEQQSQQIARLLVVEEGKYRGVGEPVSERSRRRASA